MLTYSHHWNVTLTCVAKAGVPRPLLVWRREDTRHTIEQSTTVRSSDGILTIALATKADEGIERRTRSAASIIALNPFD